jgi:hypothetical protein
MRFASLAVDSPLSLRFFVHAFTHSDMSAAVFVVVAVASPRGFLGGNP